MAPFLYALTFWRCVSRPSVWLDRGCQKEQRQNRMAWRHMSGSHNNTHCSNRWADLQLNNKLSQIWSSYFLADYKSASVTLFYMLALACFARNYYCRVIVWIIVIKQYKNRVTSLGSSIGIDWFIRYRRQQRRLYEEKRRRQFTRRWNKVVHQETSAKETNDSCCWCWCRCIDVALVIPFNVARGRHWPQVRAPRSIHAVGRRIRDIRTITATTRWISDEIWRVDTARPAALAAPAL